MNTREVFGYLRVSSPGQVEGDGLTRQREAVLAFCELKGWNCKRIFEERGVSGTVKSMDRPAFAEMLGLCGGVLPVTIVVERADRLARDLVVGELLLQECKKAGVEVFVCDSGEEIVNSNSDCTKVLIRQILGALAQQEKSALVKKLKSARDRIRATTGRCEGPKPFSERDPAGYTTVMAWIVGARERGDSFHAIAKQLNLSGNPSFGGGKWGPSYVYKLYQNYLKDNPDL